MDVLRDVFFGKGPSVIEEPFLEILEGIALVFDDVTTVDGWPQYTVPAKGITELRAAVQTLRPDWNGRIECVTYESIDNLQPMHRFSDYISAGLNRSETFRSTYVRELMRYPRMWGVPKPRQALVMGSYDVATMIGARCAEEDDVGATQLMGIYDHSYGKGLPIAGLGVHNEILIAVHAPLGS